MVNEVKKVSDFKIAKKDLKRSVKTYADLEDYLNFVDVYDGDKWYVIIEEKDFTLPIEMLYKLSDIVQNTQHKSSLVLEHAHEEFKNEVRIIVPYLMKRAAMLKGAGILEVRVFSSGVVSDWDFPEVPNILFGDWDKPFKDGESIYHRDVDCFIVIRYRDTTGDDEAAVNSF